MALTAGTISLRRATALVLVALAVQVADAAPEFGSTDLGHPTPLAGHGNVPRGVAALYRLTWACGKRLDDHPNDAGYRVLATVIERVVGRLRLAS